MINKNDEKEFEALKELRNALYSSLPEDKKKRVDEHEVKYGSEKIIELINEMNVASSYCIIESFLDGNPKILLDVVGFSKMLEDMFDVFGAEKVAKMIKASVPKLKENLKEKMVNEINELAKNENGKDEPEAEEPKEIEEIKKFLKDRGYDFEIVEMTEEDDD